MPLLSLAPELLDQIITWSLPLSFESLALSCKTLYTLSLPHIPVHNKLKAHWTHVTHRGSGYEDTLEILHQLAKEPLTARYIQSLSLWDRRNLYSIRNLARDPAYDFRNEQGHMETIKAFVMQSSVVRYVEEAGVDMADWRARVEQEAAGWLEHNFVNKTPYLDTTIMLLLPNLRTLRLSQVSWRWIGADISQKDDPSPPLWPVLDVLVKLANGPSFEGRALGRLERILPFMGKGFGELAGLFSVQSFLQIPSVTEAYAVSCIAVEDGYFGMPFKWRLPDYACNVRRLELAFCCIDRNGICEIVSRMPKLEVFKYAHDVKWRDCQREWNAGLFLDAVAKHCGQTITDLAITCEMVSERQGIENGISTFHEFPKLRKLDVDARSFCGPPINSGQMRGRRGYLNKGVTRWKEHDVPCLATMLPASIEELHFNFEYWDNVDPEADNMKVVVDALLKGFEDEREKQCPNLRKPVFREYGGNANRLLLSVHQSWNRPPRSTRQPLWMLEFGDVQYVRQPWVA